MKTKLMYAILLASSVALVACGGSSSSSGSSSGSGGSNSGGSSSGGGSEPPSSDKTEFTKLSGLSQDADYNGALFFLKEHEVDATSTRSTTYDLMAINPEQDADLTPELVSEEVTISLDLKEFITVPTASVTDGKVQNIKPDHLVYMTAKNQTDGGGFDALKMMEVDEWPPVPTNIIDHSDIPFVLNNDALQMAAFDLEKPAKSLLTITQATSISTSPDYKIRQFSPKPGASFTNGLDQTLPLMPLQQNDGSVDGWLALKYGGVGTFGGYTEAELYAFNADWTEPEGPLLDENGDVPFNKKDKNISFSAIDIGEVFRPIGVVDDDTYLFFARIPDDENVATFTHDVKIFSYQPGDGHVKEIKGSNDEELELLARTFASPYGEEIAYSQADDAFYIPAIQGYNDEKLIRVTGDSWETIAEAGTVSGVTRVGESIVWFEGDSSLAARVKSYNTNNKQITLLDEISPESNVVGFGVLPALDWTVPVYGNDDGWVYYNRVASVDNDEPWLEAVAAKVDGSDKEILQNAAWFAASTDGAGPVNNANTTSSSLPGLYTRFLNTSEVFFITTKQQIAAVSASDPKAGAVELGTLEKEHDLANVAYGQGVNASESENISRVLGYGPHRLLGIGNPHDTSGDYQLIYVNTQEEGSLKVIEDSDPDSIYISLPTM